MNILFVGNELKGGFAIDVLKSINNDMYSESDFESIKGGSLNDIKENIFKRQMENIIIYIDEVFWVKDADLLEFIRELRSSTNAKVIIFAPGYKENQDIIQHFKNSNINSFIFSTSLKGQKQELLNILTLKEEDFNININERKIDKSKGYITISLISAVSRIGTTTAAIQIIKYIQKNNNRACYIQMNNSNFVNEIKEAYPEDVNIDENKGLVRYKNVDMYYKKENIPNILKEEYDFYIYDYGVLKEEDYSLISYAEKDIPIFVTGSSASELLKMSKIFKKLYQYKNINYLYNFTHKNDRKEILILMEGLLDKTFFLEYSPNPFIYNIENEEIFKNILEKYLNKKEEKKKGMKKSFFKK